MTVGAASLVLLDREHYIESSNPQWKVLDGKELR
jgi:hypothetical protein